MGRKSQFCTILFYEMKKILTARVALFLFIFIAAYSIIQGIFQATQIDDFDIETGDMQHSIVGRPIDDELIAETAEAAYSLGMPFECWNYSNCTYMKVSSWLKQIIDDNSKLTDYNAESVYQKRDSSVNESMDSMKLTAGEKEFWHAQEENLDKPIIWRFPEGIRGLISIQITLPLIMLFVTTLLLSRIFAGEIEGKTNPLIRCTVGGWGTTYLAKIAAAFICTLFITIVIEAISVFTSFVLWGNDEWNIPIQLFTPLTTYPITIGQFIMVQLVMITATGLLITAFTCFLSGILKNPVVVMGSVFGSILTLYISSNCIPYSRRMPSQLLCLLSPIYMTSESVLSEYRLIGRSGHYLTALQFAPILYLAISAVLTVTGYYIYTSSRIHINKNHSKQ